MQSQSFGGVGVGGFDGTGDGGFDGTGDGEFDGTGDGEFDGTGDGEFDGTGEAAGEPSEPTFPASPTFLIFFSAFGPISTDKVGSEDLSTDPLELLVTGGDGDGVWFDVTGEAVGEFTS